MILRRPLLRIRLLLTLLKVRLHLLKLLKVACPERVLHHNIMQRRSVTLTRARRANHRHKVLSTNHITVYILTAIVTCMSRHLRDTSQQNHRLVTLVKVPDKQLMQPCQSLRRLRRIIPLRVKFLLFFLLVTRHFLRLSVNLTHFRIHIHGEVIVIEVVYRTYAILILRVIRQFLSHHRKRLFSRHQFRKANRQHRHKVVMPVVLTPYIHFLRVKPSLLNT